MATRTWDFNYKDKDEHMYREVQRGITHTKKTETARTITLERESEEIWNGTYEDAGTERTGRHRVLARGRARGARRGESVPPIFQLPACPPCTPDILTWPHHADPQTANTKPGCSELSEDGEM